MNRISTHVLNTSAGEPARGIVVRLLEDGRELASSITDNDGRCANLLPEGYTLKQCTYELVFNVADYFPDGFYPKVNIFFKATNKPHYHVPLLLSPFGYTTYRGS